MYFIQAGNQAIFVHDSTYMYLDILEDMMKNTSADLRDGKAVLEMAKYRNIDGKRKNTSQVILAQCRN